MARLKTIEWINNKVKMGYFASFFEFLSRKLLISLMV